MKPIAVLPIREQVADALRKAIFYGELKKGEELTQDDVATKLGVSRMPVREAFQILERDGLLILNNHRKAVVRGITKEDVLDQYDIRIMLEGEAAARACLRKEVSNIIKAHEQVEKAAEASDPALYVEANACFHQAIWKAAGSRRLTWLLEQVWNGIPPHLPELVSSQIEYSLIEHRQIVHAIQLGNSEEARKLIGGHISRSMNHFIEYFQNITR
jgi:DNA-binding GntR family transcriptional regulator